MNTTPEATVLKLTKFVTLHGHARNRPSRDFGGTTRPIMETSVRVASAYQQVEGWMPNTTAPGPIKDAHDVREYLDCLEKLTVVENDRPAMRHVVIVMLLPDERYNDARNRLKQIKDELGDRLEVLICKVYAGNTTNIEANTTKSFKDLYSEGIRAAVELGFIVAIHAEKPGQKIDTYEREVRSMNEDVAPLIDAEFPQGRFNIEHVSCPDTIKVIRDLPSGVTGGITVHHPFLHRNDFLECQDPRSGRQGVNLHLACRPPIQHMDDMTALQDVVLNAHRENNRRFHLSPDSAPHSEEGKASHCGCNGVFSAPVLGPFLAHFFDLCGGFSRRREAFEAFTVWNAARNYGVSVDKDNTFELVKGQWRVPDSYAGIVPLFAGRELSFRPTDPVITTPDLLIRKAYTD